MAKQKVEFRLEPETIKRVEKYRTDAGGITPTQFFTEATLQKLGGAKSSSSGSAEVRALRQEVALMREELSRATFAILKLAGSDALMPEAEVKSWVQENMNQRVQ